MKNTIMTPTNQTYTTLEIGGTLDEVKEANGKGILLRSYYKKVR